MVVKPDINKLEKIGEKWKLFDLLLLLTANVGEKK